MGARAGHKGIMTQRLPAQRPLRAAVHITEPHASGQGLSIRLRFLHCGILALNENHPVLLALRQQLAALRQQYRSAPDEGSRYRLVRHEQLIAQWAPGQDVRV